MNNTIIVTGTDTDIGKTVFAAGLTAVLGATYWKPVQAGTQDCTDRYTIAALTGATTLPEAYRLTTPVSPHLAARIDGVEIVFDRLALPSVDGPLVVEGAGGVLVPVTDTLLMADLFAHWRTPAILCAPTGLGTINHSLLSVEALKARGVPLIGIAFIGEAHEENERIIPALAGVPSLGRLPILQTLTPATLVSALRAIDIAQIRRWL